MRLERRRVLVGAMADLRARFAVGEEDMLAVWAEWVSDNIAWEMQRGYLADLDAAEQWFDRIEIDRVDAFDMPPLQEVLDEFDEFEEEKSRCYAEWTPRCYDEWKTQFDQLTKIECEELTQQQTQQMVDEIQEEALLAVQSEEDYLNGFWSDVPRFEIESMYFGSIGPDEAELICAGMTEAALQAALLLLQLRG
jgi:hypothetical protein